MSRTIGSSHGPLDDLGEADGFPAAGGARMGALTRDRPGGGGGRNARRGRTRPRAARRASWLGPHRARSIVSIVVTVVLVVAALWGYVAFRNVYDAIHRETVTSQMLGARPPKLNGSLNVLMIGSDSRKGTKGYGQGIAGARSDTAMLLHISPTGKLATVISFPRDSMVPIYRCLPDGEGHTGQQAAPGQLERLNATFSFGGVPCLWKTLEQTTHIHIDDFMEVDFNGFKKIVNDLGGVSVCLPYPIRDYRSGLRLSAGRHVVNGTQALAFVRVRHIGNGSDLERIKRQQLFLASVAQKVRKSGLLSNLGRTYSLIRDMASSLTVDTALSLSKMEKIANTLRGLSTKSLHFISVPVIDYPPDPMAEVEWAPSATGLFSAIAHDNHILKAASQARKGAKPKASPAPTVSPAQVSVFVMNGSGTQGLAATAASDLANRGFTVTGQGNAPSFGYTSNVIEYGRASQLPEVNTLKKSLPGVIVKRVRGMSPGAVNLILGSNFNGLSSQSRKQSVSRLTKNYGGISGNTNICRDSAAWAP